MSDVSLSGLGDGCTNEMMQRNLTPERRRSIESFGYSNGFEAINLEHGCEKEDFGSR